MECRQILLLRRPMHLQEAAVLGLFQEIKCRLAILLLVGAARWSASRVLVAGDLSRLKRPGAGPAGRQFGAESVTASGVIQIARPLRLEIAKCGSRLGDSVDVFMGGKQPTASAQQIGQTLGGAFQKLREVAGNPPRIQALLKLPLELDEVAVHLRLKRRRIAQPLELGDARLADSNGPIELFDRFS